MGRKASRIDIIEADVIILGCSLPGIVTAHKLKKMFGDTMEIVVLDLSVPRTAESRIGVVFQAKHEEKDRTQKVSPQEHIKDNVARFFLLKYAEEFDIPIPDAIVYPNKIELPYDKVFEHSDGSTVRFTSNYHDFSYFSWFERFELSQYQTKLDRKMREIFNFTPRYNIAVNKNVLRYHDSVKMENHICGSLLFPLSREIMRTIVKLVCGTSAENVSVLFYLHQCHRATGSNQHIDGDNTRLREKLLRFCHKRFTSRLQKSVEDITVHTKKIEGIRTYSQAQVILETMMGDANYVCSLLAMALRPEQLNDINVEKALLSEEDAAVLKKMVKTNAKRFFVTYEDQFWRTEGYSGDIVSLNGPIIWATEKPVLTTIDSSDTYPALTGFLRVVPGKTSSKQEVLKQLVKLFGEKAAKPSSYRETDLTDIYVPRCGDYVALRTLIDKGQSRKLIEWGPLDIFGDGDIAGALQAGNEAYLHLLGILRPQAATYEDKASRFTLLDDNPFKTMFARINYISTVRTVLTLSALYIGVKYVRSYLSK